MNRKQRRIAEKESKKSNKLDSLYSNIYPVSGNSFSYVEYNEVSISDCEYNKILTSAFPSLVNIINEVSKVISVDKDRLLLLFSNWVSRNEGGHFYKSLEINTLLDDDLKNFCINMKSIIETIANHTKSTFNGVNDCVREYYFGESIDSAMRFLDNSTETDRNSLVKYTKEISKLVEIQIEKIIKEAEINSISVESTGYFIVTAYEFSKHFNLDFEKSLEKVNVMQALLENYIDDNLVKGENLTSEGSDYLCDIIKEYMNSLTKK